VENRWVLSTTPVNNSGRSVDVAVASAITELESSLKEEQNQKLKAFHSGKHIFTLLLTGSSKSLITLVRAASSEDVPDCSQQQTIWRNSLVLTIPLMDYFVF